MAENQKKETSTVSETKDKAINNAVVLRIPKPNLQIAVLGLVAVIVLFQTFQLVRISSSTNPASVKVASPAVTTNTNSGPSGAGSNADIPQSQVGGC